MERWRDEDLMGRRRREEKREEEEEEERRGKKVEINYDGNSFGLTGLYRATNTELEI